MSEPTITEVRGRRAAGDLRVRLYRDGLKLAGLWFGVGLMIGIGLGVWLSGQY